jgi:hypothetical protein
MNYKEQPQSRFKDSIKKAAVQVAEFSGWLTFVRKDIVDAFLTSEQRVPIRMKENVRIKEKLIGIWRFFWNSNYYLKAIVLVSICVALFIFSISDTQQKESVLTALNDTPIPTILVIAGISFLLLSTAGQLTGRITVPPERHRQATIIGCLLVMVGITLHVVPPVLIPPKPAIKPDRPPQTSTPLPSTQPAPSTPKPPSQDFNVVPIPSLNARLTALRFFEGNPCEVPPLEKRAYKQRFAQVITREIYTELTLEHPKHERRLDITIQAFYRHEGKIVGRPVLETYIPADKQESIYWFDKDQGQGRVLSCIGSYPRGRWSVGPYTVDVYINGEKVTSSSFEIYK